MWSVVHVNLSRQRRDSCCLFVCLPNQLVWVSYTKIPTAPYPIYVFIINRSSDTVLWNRMTTAAVSQLPTTVSSYTLVSSIFVAPLPACYHYLLSIFFLWRRCRCHLCVKTQLTVNVHHLSHNCGPCALHYVLSTEVENSRGNTSIAPMSLRCVLWE